MSDEEFKMIQALSRCTMLPGTWEKRFVRDLSQKPKAYELTPAQKEWVDNLHHKYRKQIAALTGNQPSKP